MSGAFRIVNGPHAGKTFVGVMAEQRAEREKWIRMSWWPSMAPKYQRPLPPAAPIIEDVLAATS